MSYKYDIEIEQGTSWFLGFILKQANGRPVNLNGYTGSGQIRATVDSPTVIQEINISIDPNVRSGKVLLSLTDEQTSSFSFSRAVYAIELTDSNGCVERCLEGKVTLSPEVTRPIPPPDEE